MLPDFGPIYRETNLSQFPVEPWNTYSNVVFLLYVMYWGARLYFSKDKHPFLVFAVPILGIGLIGGTIYHATRSHYIWLLMDWVPIAFLCVWLSLYYARKLHYRPHAIAIIILLPILSIFLVHEFLYKVPWLQFFLGYPVLAGLILYPMLHHARLHRWKGASFIFAAIFVFIVALSFRALDFTGNLDEMTMGTHWLWHIFGGITVHFLTIYIYLDEYRNKRELEGM